MLRIAYLLNSGIIASLIWDACGSTIDLPSNNQKNVQSRRHSASQYVGHAEIGREVESKDALSNSLKSTAALLLEFRKPFTKIQHSKSHGGVLPKSAIQYGLVVGDKKTRRVDNSVSMASTSVDDVGVVLLSAGMGKRMGANIPKQYLKLLGKEIALRSLDVFLDVAPKEIVIVCAEEWRSLFEAYLSTRDDVKSEIKFALGGAERQDSVQNGLAQLTTTYAAVHDSARPLVTAAEVADVVSDARSHGAALLAVPTKATIKMAKTEESMVDTTPKREFLWEAHTPQVIRASLLRDGFDYVQKNDLAVTDDVSIVELLGEPVKLTLGQYTNIKVTTPEDIGLAETILREREKEP